MREITNNIYFIYILSIRYILQTIFMEGFMDKLSVLESNVSVLGKSFNIYGDYENPLFLAKDVAEWIEYAKTGGGFYDVSRMVGTVDDDEKMKIAATNILRSGPEAEIGTFNQESWFLTENGLYEVLMLSRKPIAKQFKAEIKKLLKGLRTKQLVVVELPSSDDELIAYAQRTIKLAQEKKQLEAQLKQAIREKGQISNDREASAMGKLGGTIKALNTANGKIVALETTIEELKTEPERTVLAFCQKHKIKIITSNLQKHGKELTRIHKAKGLPINSIPEGHYSVNVYDYQTMVDYFKSLNLL